MMVLVDFVKNAKKLRTFGHFWPKMSIFGHFPKFLFQNFRKPPDFFKSAGKRPLKRVVVQGDPTPWGGRVGSESQISRFFVKFRQGGPCLICPKIGHFWPSFWPKTDPFGSILEATSTSRWPWAATTRFSGRLAVTLRVFAGSAKIDPQPGGQFWVKNHQFLMIFDPSPTLGGTWVDQRSPLWPLVSQNLALSRFWQT